MARELEQLNLHLADIQKAAVYVNGGENICRSAVFSPWPVVGKTAAAAEQRRRA